LQQKRQKDRPYRVNVQLLEGLLGLRAT